MARTRSRAFGVAQRLGLSLMLPIATLPAASLLLRFGQPDMLGADGLARHAAWLQPVADVLAGAGGAIFNNLPVLFAVGVAVGFARKSDGSTGVAGLFGYLVLDGVFQALAPHWGGAPIGGGDKTINYGVLGGILIGVIAALLWQRFYRIKLPDVLAFFGGRRFVPIVTSFAAVILGVVLGAIYPLFNWLINEKLGGWLIGSGEGNPFVSFVYGFVNRLLIPLGLHHLWNSLPWFQFGTCENASGQQLHGDLTCFFQGTPETAGWTGSFMTGFFPIMMFGLMGAALAFVHTAFPARKKVTAALMLSAALTAFLTGITEPIEYSFAYAAFPLYVVHAVLTGLSHVVINLLGAKMGFGFSAGLTDFLLNFGKSAKYSGGVLQGPVTIILVGLVFFAIYYFLFRFLIVRFNFATPGREEQPDENLFAQAQETAREATGKNEAERPEHAGPDEPRGETPAPPSPPSEG